MPTTNEIAAQSFVFLLADFETFSITLWYCLYDLSQLPEVQEKIRPNVREILNKHNGKMTYEAMMEIVLVEQAVWYSSTPSLLNLEKMIYTLITTFN